MDELIKFHFAIFDGLIKSENNKIITVKIEEQINETKEAFKNTFNQESSHYLDKEFENYIDQKKESTNR
jgi:hypothetical protein